MHNGMRLQRFARNTQGRDFAVGDIHGCFSKLDAALCQVRFSPVHDRLFAVGVWWIVGRSRPRYWNGWTNPGFIPCVAITT
jgi:hypothetical protein